MEARGVLRDRVLQLIEVLVEAVDEVPVVIELLLAEFEGVEGHVNFECSEGVLQDAQV